MERQPVLPRRERCAADQAGEAGHRRRMPDGEGGRALQTRRLEQRRPVEAGRLRRQRVARPHLRQTHVGRLHARGVDGGHPRLEIDDRGGTPCRIGDAHQAEHRGDVLRVGLAQRRHLRARRHVVVTIRQPEAALQQVRHVLAGVLHPLRDEHAEQVLGLEVGGVQRIDVGADGAADGAREGTTIGDRRDGRERRLQRRQALGLDAGFVHEAGVEVGDLAGLGAATRRGLARVLDQRDGLLPRLVGEDAAGAVARLVRRDRRGLQPRAVGVGIEIVAGRRRWCPCRPCRCRTGARPRAETRARPMRTMRTATARTSTPPAGSRVWRPGSAGLGISPSVSLRGRRWVRCSTSVPAASAK